MGSSPSESPGGSAAGGGRGRHARYLGTAIALLAAYGLAGCASRRPVHPGLEAVADSGDALAVSDALEVLIAHGQDTPADREYAYELVHRNPQDTAAYLFARAAVTGRLVQVHGLRAANLVPDVEQSARRSRALDPDFRDGSATRLLGTLYVIAPAMLLQHGNSEEGLEMLEGLTEARPDIVENHLRLAEAYITLGDPAPACPHLQDCLAHKASLRPDDQQLLDQLIAMAGPLACDGTVHTDKP